jgi:hypothetical protein
MLMYLTDGMDGVMMWKWEKKRSELVKIGCK